MFRTNERQTGVVADLLDAISIVKDEKTGRFHPYFWEWHPLPGDSGISDDGLPDIVRLKSKMHHTAGFETIEAARADIASMRSSGEVVIGDESVWVDDDKVMAQDEVGAAVILVPNWR